MTLQQTLPCLIYILFFFCLPPMTRCLASVTLTRRSTPDSGLSEEMKAQRFYYLLEVLSAGLTTTTVVSTRGPWMGAQLVCFSFFKLFSSIQLSASDTSDWTTPWSCVCFPCADIMHIFYRIPTSFGHGAMCTVVRHVPTPGCRKSFWLYSLIWHVDQKYPVVWPWH